MATQQIGYKDAVNRSLAETLGGLLKGSLYEYQYQYATDQTRMVCSCWCRGAGKSYSAGWKNAIRAVGEPGDYLLTSASDDQAKELLRFVIGPLELIDKILKLATGKGVYYKTPGKTEVTLWNGSRIFARPANPRTLASFTANVTWDEVAKTLNDMETWKALAQVTRGIKWVDLLSSAWGAQGFFYSVMAENAFPEFVTRNIDIHQAIAQGLPRDIDTLRSMCDEFTWEQEYENKFQSSVSSPFHPELLKRCSNLNFLEPPQPGGMAPDGSLQQYFVGVDLGRVNDKTAIVWMTEYPKGQFQAVKAVKIEDTPLPIQEKMIEEILMLPQVNRLAIDKGGLGMQMSETLGAKFPEKLIPFDFTMQSKNALVQNALSKMERDLVRITAGCASDIVYDLSLIQRTFTSFGNMIYGAKRTASGHADGAWAFLLAMEAMREGGSGYMMMDFGLDQRIIDMINQEGSLRIRDIGSYNSAVSRLAETERDVEQRERQVMMQYCSRLTGNANVGIFTEDEIGQMTDNERDFYGMAPRGKNNGDV